MTTEYTAQLALDVQAEEYRREQAERLLNERKPMRPEPTYADPADVSTWSLV